MPEYGLTSGRIDDRELSNDSANDIAQPWPYRNRNIGWARWEAVGIAMVRWHGICDP